MVELINKMQAIVNLNKINFILFFFFLLIFFLFFQQVDLFATATSSYAYLRGHIFDFYDYNKAYVGSCDYLPLLYVIFAIWNIPLYILGFSSSPETTVFIWPYFISSTFVEIAWWKLILLLVYLATVYIFFKISNLISPRKNIKLHITAVYATSPLVIFSAIIFGGYDVFSVFFTLLGLYFYLKKEINKFLLFFSIAICFKYFALIIFLPLILIYEKRLLCLLKFLFFGFLISFLQYLFYMNSPEFVSNIFSLLLSKVKGSHFGKYTFFKLIALSIYFSMCHYLYKNQFNQNSKYFKYAVLSCLISYTLLFLVVSWHPQWLIIISPFLALSYMYIRRSKIFYISELVGFFGFFFYVGNTFPFNVDVLMMKHSILKGVLPYPSLINSDFFPGNRPFFRFIFSLSLLFPILILFFESKKNTYPLQVLSERDVMIRFLLGIGFFIIPCIFCYMPEKWAIYINPLAAQKLNDFLRATNF